MKDPTVVLTVDVKLAECPVLTVETELSLTMGDAFISADADVLQSAISDMFDQMRDLDLKEDWRIDLSQRLRFSLVCSLLSAGSGQKLSM